MIKINFISESSLTWLRLKLILIQVFVSQSSLVVPSVWPCDYTIKYINPLMRVTQTEKPFSVLEINIPKKIINDENDPLRVNMQYSRDTTKEKNKPQRQDKEDKKLVKIRRECLKKLEDIQEKHKTQISSMTKKHEQQTHILTAKYKKELTDKQQYIRLLEEMINSNAESLALTKKQRVVDQSKYVYTEHTKNYVPYYEQISDRIDFKLQPRTFEKKLSLDGKSLCHKRLMVQSFSTHEWNESSKHKLIPKVKPSPESVPAQRQFSRVPSYSNCGNVKISRPFFL